MRIQAENTAYRKWTLTSFEFKVKKARSPSTEEKTILEDHF